MRAQAIAAGDRLMQRGGFEAMTIPAVAAEAGIDEPAVAAEFAGPDEILAAVVTADDLRVDNDIRILIAEHATAADKMSALIEQCVVESDWTGWVELWSRSLRSNVVAATRQQLDDRFRVLLQDVIEEGQASVSSSPATRPCWRSRSRR